jgi:hypothetical protein
MKRWLWAVAVWGSGCEHAHDGDMTASEHRRLAEEYTQQAQREHALYDPRAGQQQAGGSPFNPNGTAPIPNRSPFGEGPDSLVKPYNPTAEHLGEADRNMRQAALESEAARRIEAFEDIACSAIPKEQRAACPLLASQVKTVTATANGVELTLRDDVNALDTARRLQCHLAYARVAGFERPSCPLFTRGLTLQMKGLHTVVFSGSTPDAAERIRASAARVFKGPQPVGVR